MKDERRSAVYDDELRLEAYRFEGIVQPFPAHFHEHYVLGLVERGERRLSCRGGELTLRAGDLLLLNPGDSHACEQRGSETLDYRSLTITQSVMRSLSKEITGTGTLLRFSPNVLRDSEAACDFRALHELVLSRSREFEKEEALLLSYLFERCAPPFAVPQPPRGEIDAACALMQQHFAERISLDQLCRCAYLSKSTLLRAFTREKGVTPYRYLEAVRIGEAKKLLEQGVPPAEAALRTGFSDQSHLTNFFTRFIGLAPGVCREIFTAHPCRPSRPNRNPCKPAKQRKEEHHGLHQRKMRHAHRRLPAARPHRQHCGHHGHHAGTENAGDRRRGCRRPQRKNVPRHHRISRADLKSPPERIKAIREALYEDEFAELTVADFSDLAQGCKTYQEFVEKMAQTDESALFSLGIALCGNKKKINMLIDSLPLLR